MTTQLKKKKSTKAVDTAAAAGDEDGEKAKLKKTKSNRKKTPIKVDEGGDDETGEADDPGAERKAVETTPSDKVSRKVSQR